MQGSISSGTILPEDLIPRFVNVYEDIVGADDPLFGEFDSRLDTLAAGFDGGFRGEEALYLLEELFDALDAVAPEGLYFGAHPGDGADYGFWQSGEE